MSPEPKRLLTAEQYLAIERDVPGKHEFFRGEMFAMGGASTEHNQITFNLAGTLHPLLKDRNCFAYVNDMRVKISATGLYAYPDAVITCEKPQFEDKVLDTLLNPQAVVEVLSDSDGETRPRQEVRALSTN
jgi:Uma2 family endonuclease